jgi:hypothetical protein
MREGRCGKIEVLRGHTEYALDASLIADSDLDMVLDAQIGVGVERWPLNKDTLDRIEGRLPSLLLKIMGVVYKSAVQIVANSIGMIFG